MDNDTIYNGEVHIPSAVRMAQGVIYVQDVNSYVVMENIEEYQKRHQHHLAQKQHQQLAKQKHQQQQLTQKQTQGLVDMGGLTNLHFLYGAYYGGLNNTMV